jgi:hypothetical protein
MALLMRYGRVDSCLRNGFGCQSLPKGMCCSLLFASSDEFLATPRTRGSTPGASTLAVSHSDGIDWALTINTRDWPQSGAMGLDDLAGLNGTPLPNSITHILDITPL